jgi:hypothetical protein
MRSAFHRPSENYRVCPTELCNLSPIPFLQRKNPHRKSVSRVEHQALTALCFGCLVIPVSVKCSHQKVLFIGSNEVWNLLKTVLLEDLSNQQHQLPRVF